MSYRNRMSIRRRTLAVVAAAAVLASVAACSSDDGNAAGESTSEQSQSQSQTSTEESSSSSAPSETSESTSEDSEEPAPTESEAEPALLTKMKRDGAVIAMTSDPGLGYVDGDGELHGVIADILTLILGKLGVTKFVPMVTDFPGTISAVVSGGRADIRMPGLTPNEERCESMAFTKPAFVLTYAFAVKPGNPKNLTSLADIRDTGTNLGTQGATTQEDIAKQILGGEDHIVILPDRQSGIDALRTGRVDAFVAPRSTLAAMMETNAGEFDIVGPIPDLPILAQASIVSLDNADFIPVFDKVYDEIMADGTLPKMLEDAGLDPSLFDSPDLVKCSDFK